MLFCAIAHFRPGTEAEREKNHEAFGDHLAQPALHLRLCGSLKGPQGQRTGVLVVMEAESLEQVQRFADLSPYAKSGLYETFKIEAVDIEVGSLG